MHVNHLSLIIYYFDFIYLFVLYGNIFSGPVTRKLYTRNWVIFQVNPEIYSPDYMRKMKKYFEVVNFVSIPFFMCCVWISPKLAFSQWSGVLFERGFIAEGQNKSLQIWPFRKKDVLNYRFNQKNRWWLSSGETQVAIVYWSDMFNSNYFNFFYN